MSFYNRAHCVVVPSIFEGFGITVIESLAAGTRVVGTDVDGIREILQAENRAVLCLTAINGPWPKLSSRSCGPPEEPRTLRPGVRDEQFGNRIWRCLERHDPSDECRLDQIPARHPPGMAERKSPYPESDRQHRLAAVRPGPPDADRGDCRRLGRPLSRPRPVRRTCLHHRLHRLLPGHRRSRSGGFIVRDIARKQGDAPSSSARHSGSGLSAASFPGWPP